MSAEPRTSERNRADWRVAEWRRTRPIVSAVRRAQQAEENLDLDEALQSAFGVARQLARRVGRGARDEGAEYA